MERFGAIVIGGGFYGSVLAADLKERFGCSVLLVEAESDLLQKASYVNQARVHNGYHYPRSLVTGARSRVNFDRFISDYEECVDGEFEKYYAIARRFSHVNANQFKLFCDRIGAPIEQAPKAVKALFDPNLVENVFRVREVAFDASKLKLKARHRLQAAGVEQRTGTVATRVERSADELTLSLTGQYPGQVSARNVFNCTYSRLNQLLHRSGLPLVPLKHEWTEMCLIRPPTELASMGITVMCGPFFSVMPFPARGLHSLSHVRYTPHLEWRDDPKATFRDPSEMEATAARRSHYQHMLKDAVRYLPALARSTYEDSLWGIKTVLPRNEVDDGRPILFKRDYGLPGLTCIMGSKIDNVYEVIDFARQVMESTR